MEKAREFWVTPDFKEVMFNDGVTSAFAFDKKPDEETIHVIEYSAYKLLEAKLAKCIEQRNNYLLGYCSHNNFPHAVEIDYRDKELDEVKVPNE